VDWCSQSFEVPSWGEGDTLDFLIQSLGKRKEKKAAPPPPTTPLLAVKGDQKRVPRRHEVGEKEGGKEEGHISSTHAHLPAEKRESSPHFSWRERSAWRP